MNAILVWLLLTVAYRRVNTSCRLNAQSNYLLLNCGWTSGCLISQFFIKSSSTSDLHAFLSNLVADIILCGSADITENRIGSIRVKVCVRTSLKRTGVYSIFCAKSDTTRRPQHYNNIDHKTHEFSCRRQPLLLLATRRIVWLNWIVIFLFGAWSNRLRKQISLSVSYF